LKAAYDAKMKEKAMLASEHKSLLFTQSQTQLELTSIKKKYAAEVD